MAIAGFVCAFVCGLVGVILSAIAMSQIGKSQGRLTGKGLAIAGLVISIVSTVWMIGVMSAVAIPAFMEYSNKSKGSEAQIQLNRMSKSVKSYAGDNGGLPVGEAPLTPAEPCCRQPGHKCQSFDPSWQDPAWQKFEFSVDDRGLFQYTYRSTADRFVGTAVGDLDCDGNEVSYTVTIDLENGYPRVSPIMKSGSD